MIHSRPFAPFEQLTFHNDSVYSIWISGDSLVYFIYRKSRTTLVLFYLENEESPCTKKRKTNSTSSTIIAEKTRFSFVAQNQENSDFAIQSHIVTNVNSINSN